MLTLLLLLFVSLYNVRSDAYVSNVEFILCIVQCELVFDVAI